MTEGERKAWDSLVHHDDVVHYDRWEPPVMSEEWRDAILAADRDLEAAEKACALYRSRLDREKIARVIQCADFSKKDTLYMIMADALIAYFNEDAAALAARGKDIPPRPGG